MTFFFACEKMHYFLLASAGCREIYAQLVNQFKTRLTSYIENNVIYSNFKVNLTQYQVKSIYIQERKKKPEFLFVF